MAGILQRREVLFTGGVSSATISAPMQKTIRYRVKNEAIDDNSAACALVFVEDAGNGILRVRREGSEKWVEGSVERSPNGAFVVTVQTDATSKRLDTIVSPATEGIGSTEVRVQGSTIDGEFSVQRAIGSNSVAPKAAHDASQRQARAAMPGRVVEIHVKEGDLVAPGHALLVLEAMKMQNDVLAQDAGRIQKIHVKVGDNVERKALLIDIDLKI